ncbi:hypothetical protein BBSC_0220 [Bifidobacterium scardovii JCM 12489 = DSM 13734]|nr:hypothetical protein BBSC_0220 [Bifidobacterium scardovii JCM 12489 = DSM 13734]
MYVSRQPVIRTERLNDSCAVPCTGANTMVWNAHRVFNKLREVTRM